MPQVEFRDGYREVPDHVEAMLHDTGVETFRYTFEEAIRQAERKMVSDRLESARREMIRQHFRENP